MGMGEAEIYERCLGFLIVKTILIIFSHYPVSESNHFRSLEDVSRVITFAKLNEDDLLPVTQVHSALHTKHDWTSNAKACSRSSLLLLPSVVVI